ncbi:hypothetical protein MKZ38_009909 [Zalerion maritima]|uniref:Uncharacterized protein n=1 Tax=Zalerion maritima TaxID=339359 RepID=A0AAD5WT85_9PEZI|nr:hypothetical protein MKZ38_009909 [Zalerion maritima]
MPMRPGKPVVDLESSDLDIEPPVKTEDGSESINARIQRLQYEEAKAKRASQSRTQAIFDLQKQKAKEKRRKEQEKLKQK